MPIREELYLEPERPQYNKLNGRFLKGHVPFCKGKKWDEWMPNRKKNKCLRALKKGRGLYKGKIIPPSIQRMKKVFVKMDGVITSYPSIHSAALVLDWDFRNISNCCIRNHRDKNKVHKSNGLVFVFENEIYKLV